MAAPELTPFESRGSEASLLGECRLGVRRSDLDGVGHANNTRYVGWGLEPIPEEWLAARTLTGLDIVYRREARLGDIVTSRAVKREGETMRLSHELLLDSSAEPLAELETRWRPR